MKKLLPIILLFLFVCSVHAQTIIKTNDKQRIVAQIQNIGLDSIQYKPYKNQQGESQYIRKDEVKYLWYEDGSIVRFDKNENDYNKDFEYKNPKTQLANNDISNNDVTGKNISNKFDNIKNSTYSTNAPAINDIQRKYNAAYALRKNGRILLGVGVPSVIVGSVFITLGSMYYGGIALTIIGGAMVGAAPFLITFGIIYLATANIRLNDLNFDISLYKNSNTSLNMAYTGNGIGLKLKF